MTKTKWLIYTVLLGLLPAIIRLVSYSLVKESELTWIESTDLITFGLVLSITNISMLEHRSDVPSSLKTKVIGISLLFVAMFACLMLATCFSKLNGSQLDGFKITLASFLMSFAIACFSFAVFDRVLANVEMDLDND